MLIDIRNKRLIDTTTNLSAREYSATNDEKKFDMGWNTTSRPRPDLQPAADLDALSPIVSTGEDRIPAGDGAKSDTAIEESMGIISACRSAERRRPTTLRQLPDAERPHRTRQVLAAALEDFAHQLHGKRIFSKIDLIRAYHQMPIAPEDVEETAIATPFGV